MLVVELGALLHDIADWKFYDGNLEEGPAQARAWLEKLGVDDQIISQVGEIVKTVSFKGAGVKTDMKTLEGMVVQDADRLDAIGAVGIARTFAYGGGANREIYNPEKRPANHETFEQYQKNQSSSVNHFYEKLLLLKDLMNTESAKKLAKGRHQVMEDFLVEFYQEWEGKK